MKILLVSTGGTIGSTLQDEYINIDKNINILNKYKENFENTPDFDVTTPFTILSEKNNGTTLKMLCETISEYSTEDYDGIIITHGTDTLQYSAAALSYALGNYNLPICLVSSNYPLEDSKANGLNNFHAAVLFIKQNLGKGVFVAYQNNDKNIYIHRGTRLLKSDIYSDNVRSVTDSFYGYFNSNFEYIPNENYAEIDDQMETLSAKNLTESATSILPITVCPGLCYPKILDNIRYILLYSYHSGTIDTASESAVRFYNDAKQKNVKVYLIGSSPSDNYATIAEFSDYGITPVYGISPISAYLKIWLADSNNLNTDSILEKSLGGDIIK